MAYCQVCGAEIEENLVLCSSCELRLIPEKKRKPKNRITKILKIVIMIVSYILMIVFIISFIYITRVCFKSNNYRCYSLSMIFLILFSCFCFIAAILVGEEIPKWRL
ncbi:MAG: DUF2116 family Zn-ribbon domain-containing protein [Promethearchaeota archaeon]